MTFSASGVFMLSSTREWSTILCGVKNTMADVNVRDMQLAMAGAHNLEVERLLMFPLYDHTWPRRDYWKQRINGLWAIGFQAAVPVTLNEEKTIFMRHQRQLTVLIRDIPENFRAQIRQALCLMLAEYVSWDRRERGEDSLVQKDTRKVLGKVGPKFMAKRLRSPNDSGNFNILEPELKSVVARLLSV